MKITRDRTADAAYFKVSDTPVARTLEVDEDIYIDLDADNNVVGVELLNASSYLDRDQVSIIIPPTIDSAMPIGPQLVFG